MKTRIKKRTQKYRIHKVCEITRGNNATELTGTFKLSYQSEVVQVT